jgi:hypothetical protein
MDWEAGEAKEVGGYIEDTAYMAKGVRSESEKYCARIERLRWGFRVKM